MDNSTNEETSRSSLISLQSFNKTINHLFSTPDQPKPSVLAQKTSRTMKNMVRHSFHIMFLTQCSDHDYIPKGLTLKDPVGSFESGRALHNASMTLVKQQLKHHRSSFTTESKCYDSTMAILNQLLDTLHHTKLVEIHSTTSRRYHTEHLQKHQKKFNDLIKWQKVPYLNPYDNLRSFDISQPTFSGLFRHSTPTLIPSNNVISNAVVNLTDQPMREEETNLLSLGLKFSPTMDKSTVAETSSRLEPTLKKLDPAVESAVTYEVANNLQNSKSIKSNLAATQQKAFRSLKAKSHELKILPADKGNAAVVMSNEQYKDKMEEHLCTDTYSLLKKDPTESLPRKLDAILKKLLKERKISKKFHDDSRVLHPRPPQIYGLPKIYKPGNPLQRIVSFYGTPLSALHKQLAHILKPLTMSTLRLKNSEDFLEKFRYDVDPDFT